MNMQDIADFLDLIKNPEKYDAAMKTMQDEQKRLNASIATVGVAGEINKIRKDIENRSNKLDGIYEQKVATVEAEQKKWLDKIALTDALSKQELDRNKLAAKDLAEKEAAYKTKLQEITTREQLLVNLESVAMEKEQKLNAMLAEYDEKIAKLKSVMV